MTSLVLGVILIVGGIAFAVYPFIRRKSDADGELPASRDLAEAPSRAVPAGVPARPAASAPSAVNDRLVAELEELELDRAMGKMGEQDYQRLRAAVESRMRRPSTESRPGSFASPVTSAEEAGDTIPVALSDSAVGSVRADEPVTDAVGSVSAPTASSTSVDFQSSSSPASSASATDLAALATEAERLIRAERARVVTCAECGARPEPAAHFCSKCGRALGDCPACRRAIRQAEAKFCDQCGTSLLARA
jgi:hypothetical protein